ncbi:NADP-dependent oxidoreductase [Flavobacterium sp. 14A]|uniref:NADP-dependent oxidoreductase n=1 Tax=Flavobacterium sp. 14A TaxID=2735896 RepID=UPI00156E5D10|nr:NADP-dependent oxidoreductase [Flavobacterium sp. 14A]NRT12778.1 hypothetical protein [Flavobacterium sp. 14A]
MSHTILLNKRPVGRPEISDFKTITEDKPTIDLGEILLKTSYVSVDPYLRGRMSDAKSYAEPFELNKPMVSGIIAEVVASNNDTYKVGQFVSGMLAWKEFQKHSGDGLRIVDTSEVGQSVYLGALGMTGMTALLGLTEIGKPKKGETLIISGAAGAVGSIVGQIGKILGCRVVGIAGSDEKVSMLKTKFGFDEGINYNTTENMAEAIKKACPDGVDVYFDNVGGEISDAVLYNINRFARMIICGAISAYNETETVKGVSVQPFLVKNSALMQGFILGNYAEKFPEATSQLLEWFKAGKIKSEETVVEGFDNIPQAFIDLFDGKNKGKMVVKV